MATRSTSGATRHHGPIWTHDLSVGEQLGITAAWAALLATLGIAGVLPSAPFGVGDWVVTYGLTLLAAVPAFVGIELLHHRLFPVRAAGRRRRVSAR